MTLFPYTTLFRSHGLEGLFQAPDGEARAMIFINLLSRPQVVSVELNQLAPARR
jgi:hypothetical protein